MEKLLDFLNNLFSQLSEIDLDKINQLVENIIKLGDTIQKIDDMT